jgi:hypothetical protein
LPAFQVTPDGDKGVGGRDGLGPRCDERAVHRAGGRPDDHVGLDAALVQGVEHPGLDRAEAGAARQNGRNLGFVVGGHVR